MRTATGTLTATSHKTGNAPAPTTVYLAIRLPDGATSGDLAKIQNTLTQAAQRTTTATGRAVYYLHSMYLPGQTRLLCEFTADSEEAVRMTANMARLPFTQINAA